MVYLYQGISASLYNARVLTRSLEDRAALLSSRTSAVYTVDAYVHPYATAVYFEASSAALMASQLALASPKSILVLGAAAPLAEPYDDRDLSGAHRRTSGLECQRSLNPYHAS